MSCLTVAELFAVNITDLVGQVGVAATYYPQILNGGGDGAAVSVTGIFADVIETAPADTLTQTATFTLPYSATLGFIPRALDRLVIGGVSYRVVVVEVGQAIGTTFSYSLTLQCDGWV